MTTALQSKVWFITGCSSGLGRALAQFALERGERVAATARNPDSVCDLLERYGSHVSTPRLDVTRPSEVRAAIDAVLERFGRIDVLVNNAGYGLQGAVEDVTDEQIRANFATNVFGALDVIRAALPVLRRQGAGHIVNISFRWRPGARAAHWDLCCYEVCFGGALPVARSGARSVRH